MCLLIIALVAMPLLLTACYERKGGEVMGPDMSLPLDDIVVSGKSDRPEEGVLKATSGPTVNWKFPFCGTREITCKYGCGYHVGNDYYAIDWNLPGWNDFNQPVVAPASGTVKYVGSRSGYGNVVEVDAGGGYFYRLAHLNSFGVQAGQWVSQGAYLGATGNTGISSGPHIHFAIYYPAMWSSGTIIQVGSNIWGHGMSVPQEGLSGQSTLSIGPYYASGQACQSR